MNRPEGSPHRLLRAQLRRQPRLLVMTVGFSLAAAAFESASVGLLVPILRGITERDATTSIPVVGRWLDDLAQNPTQRLGIACLVVAACVWLRCLFGYLAATSGFRLGLAVLHDLRVRVFHQLTEVGIGYFGRARTGSLVNTLTTEFQRVETSIGAFANVVFSAAVTVAYLVLLVAISPPLAAIAVGMAAIVFLVLRPLLQRVRAAGAQASRSTDTVISAFSERLSGARTIRTFAAEQQERRDFEDLSRDTLEKRNHELRSVAATTPLAQGLLSTAIVGLVFMAFVLFVEDGRVTGPALLTFFFALFRLGPTVQFLLNSRAVMAANEVGFVSLDAVLRSDDKPFVPSGPVATPPLQRSIELRNVSFAYREGEPVLHDVSLTIEWGRTTALVGHSGSGKSTLADLLVRFYDPSEGSLRWDGIDYRELDLASLRRRLGVVSQETFVFHDTVGANVAYGIEGASGDAIWKALREADAEAFVRQLPHGLDTIVGERGILLSGGERQRLAIARALLRDPDVLILDEATSSLDAVTERAVQHALERLMVGRTVLVIAHRLSTIEHADHVAVLDAGRVVEQGTYTQLIAQDGHLARQHTTMYGVAPRPERTARDLA